MEALAFMIYIMQEDTAPWVMVAPNSHWPKWPVMINVLLPVNSGSAHFVRMNASVTKLVLKQAARDAAQRLGIWHGAMLLLSIITEAMLPPTCYHIMDRSPQHKHVFWPNYQCKSKSDGAKPASSEHIWGASETAFWFCTAKEHGSDFSSEPYDSWGENALEWIQKGQNCGEHPQLVTATTAHTHTKKKGTGGKTQSLDPFNTQRARVKACRCLPFLSVRFPNSGTLSPEDKIHWPPWVIAAGKRRSILLQLFQHAQLMCKFNPRHV